MNRRYALIALDHHHECADFSGCHLALFTRLLNEAAARRKKFVADPKNAPVCEIVEPDSGGRI